MCSNARCPCWLCWLLQLGCAPMQIPDYPVELRVSMKGTTNRSAVCNAQYTAKMQDFSSSVISAKTQLLDWRQ